LVEKYKRALQTLPNDDGLPVKKTETVRETDAQGNTVSYQYTPDDSVKQVTDKRGKSTHISCAAVGRITAVIDALGNKTEFTYDAAGNLIEIIDPKGDVTKNDYDLPVGQRDQLPGA